MNHQSNVNEDVQFHSATNTDQKHDIHRSDLDYMIDAVQNPFTRFYIRNRVMEEMRFYAVSARSSRRQYLKLMTFASLMGALIPVATVLADGKLLTIMRVIIASLGAAVSFINTYLSIHESRELWVTYRDARNKLLKTLYQYFNDVEDFSRQGSQKEKDALLIHICEDVIEDEKLILEELKKANNSLNK